jgi:glutamate-ammonia-ligase adenylyltransferase
MSERINPHLESIPEPLRDSIVTFWQGFSASDEVPEALFPELVRVWATSTFVARGCVTKPDIFLELIKEGSLHRAYRGGELSQCVTAVAEQSSSQDELMHTLRRLRQREMMRITWRDLAGLCDLEETLSDTSDLAEACVSATLDWCYRELTKTLGTPRNSQGEAQQMLVLGMGKLGGRELNFSSDVDLIFAYPEGGQTDGARVLDNQQFFIRLGQMLIKILNENTTDGFVYRVDMRLRPFGDSGPLASSFAAFENYYLTHGREWERYALIKARVIAGDQQAGKEFSDLIRPFVFRRYLDYGAFEELREIKDMIDRQARSKGQLDNVKIGPGGIREIEFIGQAFQLVRGGRDPALQIRGICDVLRRLAQRNLIPDHAEARLQHAYNFLRRTENHLQMVADQQVHSLPENELERTRLAFSMNFDSWDDFKTSLDEHRDFVAHQFDQIFAARQEKSVSHEPEVNLKRVWDAPDEEQESLPLLQEAGFEHPEAIARQLEGLKEHRAIRLMTEKGRNRLDRLMPRLLQSIAGQARSDEVLERFIALLQAIAGRTGYIALISDQPGVLDQLVRLFAASGWIAERVTRHPILLDELIDPETLYHPPERADLHEQLAALFRPVAVEDIEQIMEVLRQFKLAQVFRVAAADIMDALPVMKVSDHLTWIAEVILEQAVDRIWTMMVARHGRPRCEMDGEVCYPQLGVIAYGKLGGIELGYSSDLDIVFVHNSEGQKQQTDGERSLENSVFFARLVQRLITLLTAFTPSGDLYEVDMRLRPSGNSGLLVSSLAALEKYQHIDAWTWEHQSLLRARPVVGDQLICEAFGRIRADILCQPRDSEALRDEVRGMREKMWQEKACKQAERFDLKKDPGGITDIEFMVQYSVLAQAHKHPELIEFTDNVRNLEGLAKAGILSPEDAEFLADAYRTFRDTLHALSLQGTGSDVGLDVFVNEREGVKRLWRLLMQGEPFKCE